MAFIQNEKMHGSYIICMYISSTENLNNRKCTYIVTCIFVDFYFIFFLPVGLEMNERISINKEMTGISLYLLPTIEHISSDAVLQFGIFSMKKLCISQR